MNKPDIIELSLELKIMDGLIEKYSKEIEMLSTDEPEFRQNVSYEYYHNKRNEWYETESYKKISELRIKRLEIQDIADDIKENLQKSIIEKYKSK